MAESLDNGAVASLRAHAQQAEHGLQTQALPGPTGESNELRLHGRGVIAVLAQGATPAEIHAAIAAAVVAGNAVVLLGADNSERLREVWLRAGLPAALLSLQPGDNGTQNALLADARLAGVCLAGAANSSGRAVLRQLVARPGAILPLISAAEVANPRQQYRFAAEQTLTINTAAAGGNAALLAGLH
ncbi:aldehyde dehydrogenase family protein [Paucibacter sp. APW11]|uniref:Aldehyde dehydrogenase family protein n=1 Tax=Roseateles aquae TaxID=3077235 RepID=A0ABU3PGZ0_9BURK|nr:aldehyde dehydrogenase family protein [Paucibacter sp. APW11]MDT9001632.1 aldehyde dehydrogenase family protein [Paucibacter sp. APW11]